MARLRNHSLDPQGIVTGIISSPHDWTLRHIPPSNSLRLWFHPCELGRAHPYRLSNMPAFWKNVPILSASWKHLLAGRIQTNRLDMLRHERVDRLVSDLDSCTNAMEVVYGNVEEDWPGNSV